MQPVKKHLKKFVTASMANDEFKRKLDTLTRVSKSDEWRIVIELLWGIKNEMAIELLESSVYMKDTSEAKDIKQKVYHNISEWIDFLTNPVRWVGKKARIQLLSEKLKGVKPERKEKQNG